MMGSLTEFSSLFTGTHLRRLQLLLVEVFRFRFLEDGDIISDLISTVEFLKYIYLLLVNTLRNYITVLEPL